MKKKQQTVYYDAKAIVANWRTCKYGQATPQAAKNLEALSSGKVRIGSRKRVWDFSKENEKLDKETLTVPIRILSPISDVNTSSEDWTCDGSVIVEYGFNSLIKWIPMVCLVDEGNVVPNFTIEMDLGDVCAIVRCKVVVVSKDVQKRSFANIYLPFIDDKMNVIPEHQLSFEDDKNDVDFDGGILIGEDKNLFRHELEEEFEEEDMDENIDEYPSEGYGVNVDAVEDGPPENVASESVDKEDACTDEMEQTIKAIIDEETDDLVKEINKIHKSQDKKMSTMKKISIGVGIAVGIGGIAGLCCLVKKEMDKHK